MIYNFHSAPHHWTMITQHPITEHWSLSTPSLNIDHSAPHHWILITISQDYVFILRSIHTCMLTGNWKQWNAGLEHFPSWIIFRVHEYCTVYSRGSRFISTINKTNCKNSKTNLLIAFFIFPEFKFIKNPKYHKKWITFMYWNWTLVMMGITKFWTIC